MTQRVEEQVDLFLDLVGETELGERFIPHTRVAQLAAGGYMLLLF